MKKIFVICLLISAMGFASKKNLESEIGIGVSLSNEVYKMENKSKAEIFPMGVFSYKNLYLDGTEIGVDVVSTENLYISAFTDFKDGYDVKGEKLERGYKSFRDRKNQMSFGGRVGYMYENFEGYISAKGGKRGSTSEAGINYTIPVGDSFLVSAGASYRLYSPKFTDYYFGVHKADLGGKLQKEYKPGKTFSYGGHMEAEYRFTDNFSTFALVSAERFSKEIHNSPVVRSRTNVTGGLGIKYKF